MHFPARQLPNQPTVNGSKSQFAGIRLLSRAFYIFENPHDLACGEVSIDQQSCFLPDGFFKALFPKLVADACGAAVLPHNRVMYWLACLAFPYDRGLALICDTKRRNVARPGIR